MGLHQSPSLAPVRLEMCSITPMKIVVCNTIIIMYDIT